MAQPEVSRHDTLGRYGCGHFARVAGAVEVNPERVLLNTSFTTWTSMTTLLDCKTTLAYLAYLGFPGDTRTDALIVTRPRKVDRRRGRVTRNVLLCYVCGAAGSGKTSMLRAFVGKSYKEAYEPTSKMFSAVNSVAIDGSEKYLVVRPASTGVGILFTCIRLDARVWF